MNVIRAGLLRALAFHDAWGYAPTRIEWIASWDAGRDKAPAPSWSEVDSAIDALVAEKQVTTARGRFVFPDQVSWIAEHERREAFFPHKIRRARRVAAWLRRLASVRWVGLCNTTALANAREDGDLDFFIVTKAGSLWQTRGIAALPFKLLGARPGARGGDQDAVCLSFFIDDAVLNLAPLQLDDDPYFRHWFLSLVPLFDDGIGESLWQTNPVITARHPLAERWLPHPTLTASKVALRIPILSFLERIAIKTQQVLLPKLIQQTANASTDVVVTDHILKLHTIDGREAHRKAYYDRCKAYDVDP